MAGAAECGGWVGNVRRHTSSSGGETRGHASADPLANVGRLNGRALPPQPAPPCERRAARTRQGCGPLVCRVRAAHQLEYRFRRVGGHAARVGAADVVTWIPAQACEQRQGPQHQALMAEASGVGDCWRRGRRLSAAAKEQLTKTHNTQCTRRGGQCQDRSAFQPPTAVRQEKRSALCATQVIVPLCAP